MSFEKQSLSILCEALDRLEEGFGDLPAFDNDSDMARLRRVLMEAADKLQDYYSCHYPLYAGQMLKPPHPVARLVHMLAMWINPNNHALDGGRASSAMEKEAVADIAAMQGKGDAFHMAVFRAFLVDGKNLARKSVLLKVARSAGLPEACAETVLDRRTFKEAADRECEETKQLGIHVLPTVIESSRRLVGFQPYGKIVRWLEGAQV